MDLLYLLESINLAVLGICLCVGFVIKQCLHGIDNRYIPLIMLVLGTALSISANWGSITLDVILGGMISGLASTGLYETFRNLIKGGTEKNRKK